MNVFDPTATSFSELSCEAEKQSIKRSKPLIVGIITSTFPFGSAEGFLYAELDKMSKLGCKLIIFPAVPVSRRNVHPDLKADIVRFPLLSLKTFLTAFAALPGNMGAAFRALMVVLTSRSQIWTKCKNLMLLPTSLAIASEVRRRGVQHLHAHWLSGPSTVALLAAKISGVTWSYSAHSFDIFLEDNLISRKVESASFGRVISEFGYQGILQRSRTTAIAPLEVLHLGVDIPDNPILKANDSANQISLVCPARFYHFKDHASLLVALRMVVDAGIVCRCTFAGDGPLRDSVAAKIKQLGLEEVVSMPGMIQHEQLMHQLRTGDYDAVVLASKDLEGIPVSLTEAMAAGIPCIATNIGAISELIKPDNGILVPQQDPKALAQAIISLASDPLRRRMLGTKARQRVIDSFDAWTAADSLVNRIEASLRAN